MKTSYLIAETACSHEGSITRLKKIASFAIRAGFDAIQLQIWKKEKMVSVDHKDFNTLKKVEIKYFDWKKVIKHIRRLSRK
jgi:N,N'-diacetyllegionaminate synthase